MKDSDSQMAFLEKNMPLTSVHQQLGNHLPRGLHLILEILRFVDGYACRKVAV